MKIRNEPLELELFAVVRRFPDLKGEGEWEIVGKPNSDIVAIEESLKDFILAKFETSEVSFGDAARVESAMLNDNVDRVMARGWEYSIVRLEVAVERPLSSEEMRAFPDTAARVVLECDKFCGDVWNAWMVLVGAVGEDGAWDHLSTALAERDQIDKEQALSLAQQIINKARGKWPQIAKIATEQTRKSQDN